MNDKLKNLQEEGREGFAREFKFLIDYCAKETGESIQIAESLDSLISRAYQAGREDAVDYVEKEYCQKPYADSQDEDFTELSKILQSAKQPTSQKEITN